MHTREQSSVEQWGGPTTSYALECLMKYERLQQTLFLFLLSQECKLTNYEVRVFSLLIQFSIFILSMYEDRKLDF